MTQSLDEKHDTYSHLNFKFDEEGTEWQSLITQNSYEANIYMNLDMPQLQNFGTVDNPHLIFTSEVPFRFVACAGPPSEDDFEYHENMWFMLREGPLQRCACCGQVFKLVRLRDEFSTENDYYMTGLTQQIAEEFGDQDVVHNISLFRPFMFFTFNHSHFEAPSNYIYSLMRMDEHDRFLTDPAFRMEQTKLAEEKYKVMVETMDDLDRSFKEHFGSEKIESISKEQYENLMETEKHVEVLNRHFRKVQKFKVRNILDPENHFRREARMMMKAKKRQGYIFSTEETEESMMINDYYETDNEIDELYEQQLDQLVQSRDSNKLSNFEFHESFTKIKEEDTQDVVQKMIFKYKYRLARDGKEKYLEREKIKNDGLNKWLKESNYVNILKEIIKLQKHYKKNLNELENGKNKEHYDYIFKKKKDLEIECGINNFCNYFGEEFMDKIFDPSTGRSRLQYILDLTPALKIQFGEICEIDFGDKTISDSIENLIQENTTKHNIFEYMNVMRNGEIPNDINSAEDFGLITNWVYEITLKNGLERNIIDFGNDQRIYIPGDLNSENTQFEFSNTEESEKKD